MTAFEFQFIFFLPSMPTSSDEDILTCTHQRLESTWWQIIYRTEKHALLTPKNKIQALI